MRIKRVMALSVASLATLGAVPAHASSAEQPEVTPEQVVAMAHAGEFSLASIDQGEPTLRGYPYPGGMNAAEFRFCSNPLNAGKCLKAKNAADDASSQAAAKFPRDSLYQGKGDAFRHCYWNARMTIDMNAGEAKGFGDRHESETPDGPDKNMDLTNNETGRQIGGSHRSHASASGECERRANAGQLVTLK